MTFDPVTSPTSPTADYETFVDAEYKPAAAVPPIDCDALALLAVVKHVVVGLGHDPQSPEVRRLVSEALGIAARVSATLAETNQPTVEWGPTCTGCGNG